MGSSTNCAKVLIMAKKYKNRSLLIKTLAVYFVCFLLLTIYLAKWWSFTGLLMVMVLFPFAFIIGGGLSMWAMGKIFGDLSLKNAILSALAPIAILIGSGLLGAQISIKILDHNKSLTQSVISALENYKQQTGRYPETLDNLVPQYIDKVPELMEVFHKTPRYYLQGGEYTLTFSINDEMYCFRSGEAALKYKREPKVREWYMCYHLVEGL